MTTPAATPRIRRTLTLAAALGALLTAVPAAARAADELTPVVATPIATPEPVLASDGRRHLAYELQLVNRGGSKVTVKGIQALAAGKAVAALSGRALGDAMVPYGKPQTGNVLSAGQAAFVMMDVSFPAKAKLPRRLLHRISIAERPPSRVNASRYLTAPTAIDRRRAVVVAPPLRGAGWVVGNGCCDALTAHRGAVLPVDGGMHVAERFAIDFVQIGPNGRMVDGPIELLSSYPFFGAPVYSAAAGRVVGVLDGMAETPAGSFPKGIGAAEAGGNHVVVDIGHGRFAFYAHLQPGSIRVRIGERVAVGETIGMLGNSGNSDAPHLHFHVMDGPSPLASNGVPFRFSRFGVAGTVTDLDGLTKGGPAEIDPRPRGRRARELPLNQEIVDFG